MFAFMNKSFSKYEKIFFDFNIKSLEGNIIELSDYKNKAVLVVNVASNCGFTKQYADLQKLWEIYKDKGLIVLGVPSNQFGSQEPGTNEEIKNFCTVNFKRNHTHLCRNKPISTNIMKLNRYTKVGGIALATLLVAMSFFNPGIIVVVLFFIVPVCFLVWVYWSMFRN